MREWQQLGRLPLIFIFLPNLLMAQTTPDAGVFQQQIQREQRLPLPRSAEPDTLVQPTEEKLQVGATVIVQAFRFSGNTVLTAEDLAPIVASYLNRPIDFNALQEAAVAVANAYRQLGWVVRTNLPPQAIQQGIVVIEIVEAVFDGAQLEGQMPSRVSGERILAMIQDHQPIGHFLNANALDRALLLADDLPGVNVSGSLREGISTGRTGLSLKVLDEPLLGGEVILDNTGSRSTGNKRLAANLVFNSPLKKADQLGTHFIHTEGSDYVRLGWTVPVRYDGFQIGMNGSYMRYKLITEDFRSLNAYGHSSTVGTQCTYPLVRSRLKNLYLSVNYDHKAFDNQSNHTTASNYHIDNFGLGLNSNLFDIFWGGGETSVSLILTGGDVRLGDLSASESASQEGGFTKLAYILSRQQTLFGTLSAKVRFSGQVADNALNSAEKFYLGGASGVRAYPATEGGGDEGRLFTAEFTLGLPKGVSVSSFYDHGQVKNHDSSPEYSLKGVGLSAMLATPVNLQLKTSWAHRLGNNPNATAAGKDQDGSLQKNRWLLSVTWPF